MYVFFAHIFEVSDNISSMFCTKNLFSSSFFFQKNIERRLEQTKYFHQRFDNSRLKTGKKILVLHSTCYIRKKNYKKYIFLTDFYKITILYI